MLPDGCARGRRVWRGCCPIFLPRPSELPAARHRCHRCHAARLLPPLPPPPSPPPPPPPPPLLQLGGGDTHRARHTAARVQPCHQKLSVQPWSTGLGLAAERTARCSTYRRGCRWRCRSDTWRNRGWCVRRQRHRGIRGGAGAAEPMQAAESFRTRGAACGGSLDLGAFALPRRLLPRCCSLHVPLGLQLRLHPSWCSGCHKGHWCPSLIRAAAGLRSR